MARLPGNRGWLIQQIGGEVVLFQEGTEIEIVRFDPGNPSSIGPALNLIWNSNLGDEDKSFALFWAGYFYGTTNPNS